MIGTKCVFLAKLWCGVWAFSIDKIWGVWEFLWKCVFVNFCNGQILGCLGIFVSMNFCELWSGEILGCLHFFCEIRWWPKSKDAYEKEATCFFLRDLKLTRRRREEKLMEKSQVANYWLGYTTHLMMIHTHTCMYVIQNIFFKKKLFQYLFKNNMCFFSRPCRWLGENNVVVSRCVSFALMQLL